jgi:hypothetical protein
MKRVLGVALGVMLQITASATACVVDADCDDGQVCTTDSCGVDSVCTNDPVINGTPCSDGNLCNGFEACQNGVCYPGYPPCLSDFNPCTTDVCDPIIGCLNLPNTLPCDDGDVCTLGDACSDGQCGSGTPVTACADGDGCCPGGCVAPVDGDCPKPIPALPGVGAFVLVGLLALAMLSLRTRGFRLRRTDL